MSLSVENVSLDLSTRSILKQVSLQVEQGQFVGLIGANGSGKSTILKTIYRVLKPDGGSIYLDEMNVLSTHEKKVAQQLSVVSQFNDLSFDLTVSQMVLMGRTPHKKMLESETQKDLDLLDQVLTLTGLTKDRMRSYLSLSGGEKQRVILARALIQQPKYLILDEPTNHLDIKYRLDILEVVKHLNIGVLAALHDLDDVARYCDYVYALKDGEVVSDGKPENVLTSDLISNLYGVNCQVFRHPITNGLGFYYTQKEKRNE